MSEAGRNLLLLAMLGAVVGLAFALTPDHRRPNLEFLPDMVDQPRFGATEPNPYFPDGKTLRKPVDGTVARGAAPLRYEPSPEEAVKAGEELVSPFLPADHEPASARGRVLYARFCVPCHGETGVGDGPVALRGFPPPASLLAEKARDLADGRIFHILTYGQGNMPGYATQITREDRWRVILFVRSLQETPLQPAPEAE